MAPLRLIHHSHCATRLALSNTAMRCSWIQTTTSAQVMAQIASRKLNYLLKYALETGTKFRSKLGRLKASKNSKLLPCFSRTRGLWVHRLELIGQVLAFFGAHGAHSVSMIRITTQLSKNALVKTETIFRSELGRLKPLKNSKLSLHFFQAKELWVYCSELICRVLPALCGVHLAIRWRYWICTLTLISLCITCWGLVFAEQEFDAKVLPRQTRRLIIHSG